MSKLVADSEADSFLALTFRVLNIDLLSLGENSSIAANVAGRLLHDDSL
jgi:hypothetical protein